LFRRDGGELPLQVTHEIGLHVGAGGLVGRGFVVDLIADDGGVVAIMFGDPGADALGISQKVRIRDVHVLA